MAGSVNKVLLVGFLGQDPEAKTLPSGQLMCNLSVATNEAWKGNDGERHEKTEWHRVVVWGKTGENAAKYLSKGRQVYVEGRLQTRQWDDKDGNKRFATEIVADKLVFLGGGDRSDAAEPQRQSSPRGGQSGQQDERWQRRDPPPADFNPDDDIPF